MLQERNEEVVWVPLTEAEDEPWQGRAKVALAVVILLSLIGSGLTMLLG